MEVKVSQHQFDRIANHTEREYGKVKKGRTR